MEYHNVPAKIYQVPYYSIESDAPERPREYAGLVYHLKGGTGISVLEEFQSTVPAGTSTGGSKLSNAGVYGWEYAGLPPSVKEVKRWLAENKEESVTAKKKSSQVCLNLINQ